MQGKLGVITMVAGLTWSLVSVAQTTISVTNGGRQTNGFYSVSATDIGEVPPASITYSGTANLDSSPEKLFDGGVYGSSGPSATADTFMPDAGYVITNSFDLTHAPLGYDIYSIVSLTGVGREQGYRLPQRYAVAYATVSAPSSFIGLTNVEEFTGAGVDGSELQVTVSDSRGDPIARNVAKVLITFGSSTGLGNMYREFDINGKAVRPQ